jgi:transcriptional regulator with XRE-family HTH domain
MIKNEKQYQNAKKYLQGFEGAVAEYEKIYIEGGEDKNSNAFLNMKNAESMVAKYKAEIAEYENLQNGRLTTVTMNMLGELPEILIKARIAKNWTQSELADRVGLKEQQIQRYESTDYAGASTWKLLYILDALEVLIPSVAVQVSKPKFDTGINEDELHQMQQKLNEMKTLFSFTDLKIA